MSAFLVENTTISKILTVLEKSVRQSEWIKTKTIEELSIDFFHPKWQAQVGQKMLDLNQRALGYRYGDPKQHLKYTFNPVSCTKIQALKALQCWLYQCAEGNIPETAQLYKFFDAEVVRKWAIEIVMETAEYDTADWG